MSGHCDGLLVTPTGQQLRVIVSGHCVALLVTTTGQQSRVLVSGHFMKLSPVVTELKRIQECLEKNNQRA